MSADPVFSEPMGTRDALTLAIDLVKQAGMAAVESGIFSDRTAAVDRAEYAAAAISQLRLIRDQPVLHDWTNDGSCVFCDSCGIELPIEDDAGRITDTLASTCEGSFG